jgi:hypothetical protein
LKNSRPRKELNQQVRGVRSSRAMSIAFACHPSTLPKA